MQINEIDRRIEKINEVFPVEAKAVKKQPGNQGGQGLYEGITKKDAGPAVPAFAP